MTSGSNSAKFGSLEIVVQFDLFGDLEALLVGTNVAIDELIMRAFIEAANAANSFEVAHHTFALTEDEGSPTFKMSARRLGKEVFLCISAAQRYTPTAFEEALMTLLDGGASADEEPPMRH